MIRSLHHFQQKMNQLNFPLIQQNMNQLNSEITDTVMQTINILEPNHEKKNA